MSINWREKFFAASIHFLISLAVGALAAAIIFFVWFPGAFAQMSGGTRLFFIVAAVDISLGPLISLVIYSSSKPRRLLIIDYSIVGAIQLAALLYGVFAVAVSRPVFVAFVVDRLEIVAALEVADEDLAAGSEPQFRRKSWTGPRLVAVEMPTDAKERNDALIAALGGKDVQMMPKYYRPYDSARDKIVERSKPVARLLDRNQDHRHEIERAIADSGIPSSDLRWLEVHDRFGFAVALIDPRTARPVKYLPFEATE
jgi:hypothetical protein